MLRDASQLAMCYSVSHGSFLEAGGLDGPDRRDGNSLLPLLPFPPFLPGYSCEAAAG
jgi:hypothetical protein